MLAVGFESVTAGMVGKRRREKKIMIRVFSFGGMMLSAVGGHCIVSSTVRFRRMNVSAAILYVYDQRTKKEEETRNF
jgi:hypothetical protein